jgi:hypothetical protein
MSQPRRRSSTVPPFLVEENWLERAIGEARERGEFDDLPGHGQPLQIETNDLAPEWDMAHRVLKNAGFAPLWMELGKEAETQSAALRVFLERAGQDLAERRARVEAGMRERETARAERASAQRPARRWWPFGSRRAPVRPAEPPSRTAWADLEASRQRTRQEYLARAARLDATIVAYHRELPDDLWRLQRGRRTPEEAARIFDAACPPAVVP